MTADTLPPEGFTKTLDALYASPRAKKLDYLSLNVYEPFGGPRRDPGDTDRRIPWERYMMDGEVYRTFILATNDFNTDLPVYMGENSCANIQPIGEAAQPASRRLDARALPEDVPDGDDPLHEGGRADRGVPLLDAGRRRASAAARPLQLRLRRTTGSSTRMGSGSRPARSTRT